MCFDDSQQVFTNIESSFLNTKNIIITLGSMILFHGCWIMFILARFTQGYYMYILLYYVYSSTVYNLNKK